MRCEKADLLHTASLIFKYLLKNKFPLKRHESEVNIK